MKPLVICISWLLSMPAICADAPPEIMPPEVKAFTLKKAYHMNGDSMVGWGGIDLNDTVTCSWIDSVAGQPYAECTQPRSVKTDRIIPKAAFENRFLVPPPEDRKRRK